MCVYVCVCISLFKYRRIEKVIQGQTLHILSDIYTIGPIKRKVKHWMVMPEFRYWLCERFNGHFFGIHTGFAEYNISGVRIPFQNKSTQEHRYEGWATGIGISYGYTWILGKRWNLEANIGAGYIYTKYDKYECKTCGRFKGNQKKHYFGPTKAGISLIYIIK